jgi:hypothetical protein
VDDADGLRIKPAGSSSSSSNSSGSKAGAVQQQQWPRRADHGIVHFIIGSAGRKLSDVDRGQEDWCTECVLRWGFGRFTVRSRTHLLAEYVSSETGEVLDSVEVVASDARRLLCSGAPTAAPPAAPAPARS